MKGYLDARPKYTKTYRRLCMHLSRYHDDDNDHKKIIRRNGIEMLISNKCPIHPIHYDNIIIFRHDESENDENSFKKKKKKKKKYR